MSFFTSRPPCLMSFCGNPTEMTMAERALDVIKSPGGTLIIMAVALLIGLAILRRRMTLCNQQASE